MTKFTNTTKGPKGVHTKTGLVYIDAGKTSDDLDIEAGELASAKATGYFEIVGKAKKADDAVDGPTATHRGAGSYSILDGDKELVEKLTRAEAEAFNKMDAEAKTAFIAEKTKKPEVTDAELIEALTEDEKDAFERLDDDGKAKFLADKKAGE